MIVLPSIPRPLRGRGHNQCTPFRCDCGTDFLFGLSDGVISDGDLDGDPKAPTVPVKCPACNIVVMVSPADLVSHNGQVL